LGFQQQIARLYCDAARIIARPQRDALAKRGNELTDFADKSQSGHCVGKIALQLQNQSN
jgi:hypothetical protein